MKKQINIGSNIITGFGGLEINDTVKTLIKKYRVAGFILFKRNIQSPKQVKKLIADLQKLADYPLFFGVDQEGGNVFRLGAPFTQFPAMVEVGNYYNRTKDLKTIKAIAQVMARELKAVGFNWDYAPVVDVHSNPLNPIIGRRAFSPDPVVVTKCAEAMIKGFHEEGVLSCIKHFPGHGGTSVDSHLDLPTIDSAGRLLWKRDIFPYRKLIKARLAPTLMTAHVLYKDLDRKHPATLSKRILHHLLRRRMGYKGVIVSDDFYMKAIADRYGFVDALTRFFMAGGDIALLCHQEDKNVVILDELNAALNNNADFGKKIKQAQKRISLLAKKFLKPVKKPSLTVLGSKAHLKIVEKISL
ncbi:beta-N-acetylhexosaminidase [bacterium]|nr:beta-N-acetylhexosaminidase [bacterium]